MTSSFTHIFYFFLSLFLFFSCSTKTLIISTDIPQTIYLAQAYNKTQKPSHTFQVSLHKQAYNNIQKNNSLIISSVKPSKEQNNTLIKQLKLSTNPFKQQVDLSLPYKNVLAFSIPLIVIKKSIKDKNNAQFPVTRRISHTQLQTLITSYKKSNTQNTWGFPLSPQKSFIDTFTNKQDYLTWMENTFENFSIDEANFITQYKDTANLFLLQTNPVIYNYVSSHVFFSQGTKVVNEFEIAVLTDDNNKVAAVDLIYANIVKNTPSKSDAYKLLRWFFVQKNQQSLYSLTQNLVRDIPTATLFLGRSYSNLKQTNTFILLPYNKWLSQYGPLQSDLISNIDL